MAAAAEKPRRRPPGVTLTPGGKAPSRTTGITSFVLGMWKIPVEILSGIGDPDEVHRSTYVKVGNDYHRVGNAPYDKDELAKRLDDWTKTCLKRVESGEAAAEGQPPEPDTVRILEPAEIVKGLMRLDSKGNEVFVPITDEEIDALSGQRDGDSEVIGFLPMGQYPEVERFLIPVKRYQIRPAKADVSGKKRPSPSAIQSYSVLMSVLRQNHLGMLVKVIMRDASETKFMLVTANPVPGKAASMTALAYRQQIREDADVDEVEVSAEFTKLAERLIKGQTIKGEINLTNDRGEKIKQLVEDKLAGKEVTLPEKESSSKPDDGLLAALQASLPK